MAREPELHGSRRRPVQCSQDTGTQASPRGLLFPRKAETRQAPTPVFTLRKGTLPGFPLICSKDLGTSADSVRNIPSQVR